MTIRAAINRYKLMIVVSGSALFLATGAALYMVRLGHEMYAIIDALLALINLALMWRWNNEIYHIKAAVLKRQQEIDKQS